MGAANTAQADVTAYQFSVTEVTIVVQEGNDLENWNDVAATSSDTIDGVGSALLTKANIYAAYVRLKYIISGGSGTAVLAAGINTSDQ